MYSIEIYAANYCSADSCYLLCLFVIWSSVFWEFYLGRLTCSQQRLCKLLLWLLLPDVLSPRPRNSLPIISPKCVSIFGPSHCWVALVSKRSNLSEIYNKLAQRRWLVYDPSRYDTVRLTHLWETGAHWVPRKRPGKCVKLSILLSHASIDFAEIG